MSGGGGAEKPEAVPVTEGEKIQTKLAKDQIGYYRRTYAPLEKEFLKDSNQDVASRMSGQAASAVARQGTKSLQTAAVSGGIVDSNSLAGGINAARQGGRQAGMQERTNRQLDALKVGLGVTADASRSLTQAGNIQTSLAIQNEQDRLAMGNSKDQERQALIGAVGSVAGSYGTYKYLGAKGAPPVTEQAPPATEQVDPRRVRGGRSMSGAYNYGF